MGQIIPKLNLNKTPQQAIDNSLVFAKNIKLAKDGSIVRDDGIASCINVDMFAILKGKLEREREDLPTPEEEPINTLKDNLTNLITSDDDNDLPIRYANSVDIETSDDHFFGQGDNDHAIIYGDSDIDNFLFSDKKATVEHAEYYGRNRGGNVGGIDYPGNSEGCFGNGTIERPFIYSYNDTSESGGRNVFIEGSDSVFDYIDDAKNKLITLANGDSESQSWKNKIGYYLPFISSSFFNYLKDFALYIKENPINPSNPNEEGYSTYYEVLRQFDEIKTKYYNIINSLIKKDETFSDYVMNLDSVVNYKHHTINVQTAGYKIPANYDATEQVDVTIYYYDINAIFLLLEWFRLNINQIKTFVENNYHYYLEQQEIEEHNDVAMYDYYIAIATDIITGNFNNYNIKGIIPYNTCFYLLYHNDAQNGNDISFILRYDEKTNLISFCNCNWKWNGGIINGNATLNLRSDVLLTIAEDTTELDKLTPLKTINLSYSDFRDEESIYTQTPIVPICNLQKIGSYKEPIRNGVYQFFIRYKIFDNHYTKWFPCSKEIFAGELNKDIDKSLVGSIFYVNTNANCPNSFIFKVDFVNNETNFKSFQIGFLLKSNDDEIARAWKEFDISTEYIYFNYKKEYIQKIEISDLLETTFQLYNVKNITPFKTKEYISNYIETNFNPSLQKYANDVEVTLETAKVPIEAYKYETLTNYPYIYSKIGEEDNDKKFITAITTGEPSDKGLIYKFIHSVFDYLHSTEEIKTESLTYEDTGVGIKMKAVVGENTSTNYISKYTRVKSTYDILCFAGDSVKNCYAKVGNNGNHYFNNNSWTNSCSGTEFHNNISEYNYYDTRYFDFISGIYSDTIRYKSNKIRLLFLKPILDINDNITSIRFFIAIIDFSFIENKQYPLNYNDITTLLPLQKYKFYIHYVTERGEITNGFPVDTIQCVDDISNNSPSASHNIHYPVFSKIVIPDGYKACFFSIQKVGIEVAELFNADNFGDLYRNCLEVDTNLLPITDGIFKDDSNNLKICKYHSSGAYITNNNNELDDSYSNIGLIKSNDGNFSGLAFLLNNNNDNYDENNEVDTQLIKCTPYITTNKYSEYLNMNLLGYICKVRKIKIPKHTIISLGKLQEFTYNSSAKNSVIKNNYISGTEDDSDDHIIYSNYNFNCISLTDFGNVITGIIDYDINTTEGTTTVTRNRICTYVESALASSLYKLPSMYYDYTRKVFSKKSKLNYTEFNNTVRSSVLVGDEDLLYTYRFNSGDYYNIPTHKGIITNLVAVGLAILVHTEDSLFKFSGYNTLSASGGDEVQMLETKDVFDTGVIELLGSERGYGGLQDRRCSIVTHNLYMFYDGSSKCIYIFTGRDEKLIVVSDNIYKLLIEKNIDNVDFAEDYYNDRIFINISFYKIVNSNKVSDGFVTLSFNTVSNAFVSLHDFDYDKSFNTKNYCYFIKGNNVYKITNANNSYGDLKLADNIYPSFKETAGGEYMSVVDIITKLEYSTIKNVNSISWICSKITSYNEQHVDVVIGTTEGTHNLAEENLNRDYPGDYLQIYSDSADTGILNIKSKGNSHSIKEMAFYTKPRYNLGVWTLDYFRNILNTNNKTNSDNKSLIYGKYIIVRFIFNRNNNFKLENLNLNISKYE